MPAVVERAPAAKPAATAASAGSAAGASGRKRSGTDVRVGGGGGGGKAARRSSSSEEEEAEEEVARHGGGGGGGGGGDDEDDEGCSSDSSSSDESDSSSDGSNWSGAFSDSTEEEDEDLGNYERRTIMTPAQPNRQISRLRIEMRRFRVRGFSRAYARSHILLSLRVNGIISRRAEPTGAPRGDGHRCLVFDEKPAEGGWLYKGKWTLGLSGKKSPASDGYLVGPELPKAIAYTRGALAHLAAAHGDGPSSAMAVAHRCGNPGCVRASHLVVREHMLQIYAEYGCGGGEHCAHFDKCWGFGRHLEWEGSPAGSETFEEYDIASFPEKICAAYAGATRVVYTLAELGQDWAAGFYHEDYTMTCLEARQLSTVAGYPSLGHLTFAQEFAREIDRPGRLTLSHLCHNRLCIEREHLVLEPLAVNQGRSACAGGSKCLHQTTCLRPGRYSRGLGADDDALA